MGVEERKEEAGLDGGVVVVVLTKGCKGGGGGCGCEGVGGSWKRKKGRCPSSA